MVDLNKLSEEELNAHLDSLSDEELSALNTAPADTTLSDAGRGFVKGASLGLADDIHGLVAGTGAFLTNGLDFAQAAAVKEKVQVEDEALDREAQKNSPWAFGGAELVGGVATNFIPAKGGVMLANTLMKSMGLGAVTGYGYSEANDLAGVGQDVLKGAAFGAAGLAVGKMLTPAEKTAQDIARQVEVLELKKTANVAAGLGVKTGADFVKLDSKLQNKGSSLKSAMSDVMDVVPQEELTPVQLQELFKTTKKGYWDSYIEPVHKHVDDLTQGGAVNVEELRGKIAREVKNSFAGKTPEENKRLVDGLLDDFNIFSGGRPNASLAELQELKNSFSKTFKGNSTADLQVAKGDVLSVISDMQKSTISKFDAQIGPEASFKYADSMRRYGHLSDVSSFVKKETGQYYKDLADHGASGIDFVNKLKGAVYAGSTVRGKVAGAVELVKSAFVSTKNNHFADARKYQSLISAMDNNPGRYNNLAANIAKASMISVGHTMDELGYADSVIRLQNIPVEKTYQSIQQNSPYILNILRKESPELYPTMKKALEDNDKATVGMLIGSISALPEASKFFTPALGMDGILYSDLDRSKALTQTQQMRAQAGWSNKQVMQAQELISFNKVPQFETPAQPPLSVRNVIAARDRSGKKTPTV